MSNKNETSSKKDQFLTKKCPKCGKTIPIDLNYVTWCESCNWNLKIPDPDWQIFWRRQNPEIFLFDTIFEKLNKQYAEDLFHEQINASHAHPKKSKYYIFALVLSLLIHMSTLFFLFASIFTLFQVNHAGELHWIVLALIMFGLFWISRPSLQKPPKTPLSRETFPVLYKITNDLANHIGTKPIDSIVINWEFNASFMQIGLPPKRYLTLGWPLLSILNEQEQIALLSHELAHSINKDSESNLLIFSAITTILNWQQLMVTITKHLGQRLPFITTQKFILQFYSTSIITFLILTAILTIFGAPLYLVFMLIIVIGIPLLIILILFTLTIVLKRVLGTLFWWESQRAEYFADQLSAAVAGTEATINILKKTLFSRSLSKAVARIGRQAATTKEYTDLFAQLQSLVENAPPREFIRIERLLDLETSQISKTHPPTKYRIAVLHSQLKKPPTFTISNIESEMLRQELKLIEKEVLDQLALYFHMNPGY